MKTRVTLTFEYACWAENKKIIEIESVISKKKEIKSKIDYLLYCKIYKSDKSSYQPQVVH